jgi:chromosome segregation ATPase
MSMSNVAEPIERNVGQVLADIEAQRAALSNVQREIGELKLRRRETLLSATIEEVHEVDRALDRAAITVDIAEAKIGSLEGELASVRAAKRDVQLAANLARAQQLAEEARQLIVGDYARAASSIATTLARLAAIESEVRALNARVPPGTVDVQIEAFRGYGATLGATVVLPGVTSDDADFWPTRPRRLTINEIYARN